MNDVFQVSKTFFHISPSMMQSSHRRPAVVPLKKKMLQVMSGEC